MLWQRISILDSRNRAKDFRGIPSTAWQPASPWWNGRRANDHRCLLDLLRIVRLNDINQIEAQGNLRHTLHRQRIDRVVVLAEVGANFICAQVDGHHGGERTITQILKAGVLYFVLVFGAGFVLGTIRTLWVVPHVGTRMAELMEAPLMLVVTVMAAKWTVRHFAIPSLASARLRMGGIGLALPLAAGFGLVLWLRGLSVRGYLATRDPASETVYYLMLVVFAIMPLFVARR